MTVTDDVKDTRPIWDRMPDKRDKNGAKLCRLATCDRNHYATGMCQYHYMKNRSGNLDPDTGAERNSGYSNFNKEAFGKVEDWIYLRQTNTVFNTVTCERITAQAASVSFGKGIWTMIKDRKIRQYRAECFHPTRTAPDCYNSFVIPYSMSQHFEPGEPLDPKLENMLRVLGGENVDYLLDWLAYGIQKPGQPSTCLILHGVPGSGKGTLSKLLKEIYQEFYATINANTLENEFNGWLERKLIVVAEEITVTSFRDRERVKNIMKNYVVGDRIQLNRKGVPQYEIDNLSRWMMFSNDKYPIMIEKNDRRYSVIRQTETITPEDGEHIQANLQGYANNLVRNLLCRDIAGFHPMRPLLNAAREEVQKMSDMPTRVVNFR